MANVSEGGGSTPILRCETLTRERRFVRTTDSKPRWPVSDNVRDWEFTASKPNEKWAMDWTDIPTHEGWLFLALVVDLFSRRIVGWAKDATMTSRLVVDALAMAAGRCGVIAHSDRDSQYASDHSQAELARHPMVGSMSRVGQCWDHAVVESTFGRMKVELTHGQRYATRGEGVDLGVHRGVLQPPPSALAPGGLHPWTSSSGRRTRTAANSLSTSRGEDQPELTRLEMQLLGLGNARYIQGINTPFISRVLDSNHPSAFELLPLLDGKSHVATIRFRRGLPHALETSGLQYFESRFAQRVMEALPSIVALTVGFAKN